MVNRRAPPGQEFKLASGETVHTIEELLDYLNQTTDEEFQHHVTEDRNDFANWIRHVHGKEGLAEEMEEADNRRDAIFVVKDAVDEHYKENKKEDTPQPKPPMKTPDDSEKPPEPEQEEPAEEPNEGSATTEESPPKPSHSTDHGEFMLKEFIYGLIFGFILGILAAGVLNSIL